LRIWQIKAWPVWAERRRVLALLAVVELLALVAPIATRTPVSRAQLVIAVFLASLSLSYSVFVFGWEKARRFLLFERLPSMTPNVQATWCFAAALLLPPVAAASVTALCSIGGWRTYNPAAPSRRVYRYVYSSMGTLLAATVCSWVFHRSLPLAVTLAVASVLWGVIGAGATTLAMCASGDFDAAKKMLQLQPHRMVLATMCVAVGEYGIRDIAMPLMWLSLPAAVAIHRYFVTTELRTSDRVGFVPMDQHAWLHVAKVVLDASDTVSVVRVTASDPEAAAIVAKAQTGCDAIGSTGDGGLAILLPDCPPTQGDAFARRLRIVMAHHGIDCTLAAASKPRDGLALEDLLAVLEAELVTREASKRSAGSPDQFR